MKNGAQEEEGRGKPTGAVLLQRSTATVALGDASPSRYEILSFIFSIKMIN